MNAYLLLTIVSVSSAEPLVKSTEAQAASSSASSQIPDAPRAEPASAPEDTPKESVRQQALKRSRVPRYPRLERPLFWVAGVAGLGLATAGGLYYGKALSARETLDKRKALTRDEAFSTTQRGRNAQTTALVLGGASLLAFGAATWVYLQPVPQQEGPTVSLVPGAGGGMLSLQGVLP
ncbi:hypothetical protein [Pyxidicoccus caerfyrddinensis]|uniref:hypothetical protein n=1 Tax=Pyxidicoccus caerfyrddinensis TaxID=2709663 RepID=UPI0013DBF377|nr:hypothetical protein [Pyxidicoccus caerfyrddinensis]